MCFALCNFALDKAFLEKVLYNCEAGQEEILIEAFPTVAVFPFPDQTLKGSSHSPVCRGEQLPFTGASHVLVPWREPCKAACTVDCLQEKCWVEVTEKF